MAEKQRALFPFDDAGVDEAIEAIGDRAARLDDHAQLELKDAINDGVSYANICQACAKKNELDGLKKELDHLQVAATRLNRLLLKLHQYPYSALSNEYAFAAGWVPRPGSTNRSGVTQAYLADKADFEGILDYSAVRQQLQTIFEIQLSINLTDARVRKKGSIPRTTKGERRRLFIAHVARVYSRFFGKPSSKHEGPWPCFLSVVLTHCEGKEVTVDRACELWKKEVKNGPFGSWALSKE